jgi:hypothetical protein
MPPDSSLGNRSRAPAQPHGVELQHHQVADHVFGQVGVHTQRKGDVLVDRQIGEQRRRLKQHADVFAELEQLVPGHAADVVAIHQHFAPLGAQLTADHLEQRGLAGTARAHDSGDATARDRHVDPIEYPALAARVVQVPNLDVVVFRHRPPFRSRPPQKMRRNYTIGCPSETPGVTEGNACWPGRARLK